MSLSLTTIYQPSELIEQRADLMWAVKVSERDGMLEYRVTPHGSEFEHQSKLRRRVFVDQLRMRATCVEWYSGLPCQANADFVLTTGKPKRPKMCAHVWCVLVTIKANVRRQETRRAA